MVCFPKNVEYRPAARFGFPAQLRVGIDGNGGALRSARGIVEKRQIVDGIAVGGHRERLRRLERSHEILDKRKLPFAVRVRPREIPGEFALGRFFGRHGREVGDAEKSGDGLGHVAVRARGKKEHGTRGALFFNERLGFRQQSGLHDRVDERGPPKIEFFAGKAREQFRVETHQFFRGKRARAVRLGKRIDLGVERLPVESGALRHPARPPVPRIHGEQRVV